MGRFERLHSTFKLNDVNNLIQEGFSQIDKLKWLKDVYLFSKKLGTDHLTSRRGVYGFFLNKYSDSQCY
jgi:hypothetical protein